MLLPLRLLTQLVSPVSSSQCPNILQSVLLVDFSGKMGGRWEYLDVFCGISKHRSDYCLDRTVCGYSTSVNIAHSMKYERHTNPTDESFATLYNFADAHLTHSGI
jgi:hypothetical protein